MTALSTADPGLPIDWAMFSRGQAARKSPAVYPLPWPVCLRTPGGLAATAAGVMTGSSTDSPSPGPSYRRAIDQRRRSPASKKGTS
jgi:hypothetical protein